MGDIWNQGIVPANNYLMDDDNESPAEDMAEGGEAGDTRCWSTD